MRPGDLIRLKAFGGNAVEEIERRARIYMLISLDEITREGKMLTPEGDYYIECNLSRWFEVL